MPHATERKEISVVWGVALDSYVMVSFSKGKYQATGRHDVLPV